MHLIAPFSPADSTPARYVAFLRDTYRAARDALRRPEEQWPAGSSHEISRQIMAEAECKALDIRIEYGTFDAYGRLNGYVES